MKASTTNGSEGTTRLGVFTHATATTSSPNSADTAPRTQSFSISTRARETGARYSQYSAGPSAASTVKALVVSENAETANAAIARCRALVVIASVSDGLSTNCMANM